MKKIHVLVVDDSALMRNLLSKLLNSDPEIEVVGTAVDAFAAREKIKKLRPDVLTLDIEMPKMDGVTFLSNLMRLCPMPVVMVSTLTTNGADATMRALSLGAIDFVAKPKVDLEHTLDDYAVEIITKVKTAAVACVNTLVRISNSEDEHLPHTPKTAYSADHPAASQIIAIGASTGGTEAIKEVLIRMQPDCPGIVITQHIPPVFSRSFAERMDRVSPLTVNEAVAGQQIFPGHAYIAPGDQHLEVMREGSKFRCRLRDSEPVNRHKPAVDVLFDSVAKNVGEDAIGVVLTGMGKDGAKGLKKMSDAGARTVVQDEKSSVIWGMPGAAVQEGGADTILPLENIAAKITALAKY